MLVPLPRTGRLRIWKLIILIITSCCMKAFKTLTFFKHLLTKSKFWFGRRETWCTRREIQPIFLHFSRPVLIKHLFQDLAGHRMPNVCKPLDQLCLLVYRNLHCLKSDHQYCKDSWMSVGVSFTLAAKRPLKNPCLIRSMLSAQYFVILLTKSEQDVSLLTTGVRRLAPKY